MTTHQRLRLEELGKVVGEPARIRILQELLGGLPLPAGAVAARVGLAPSTTSAHLARLHESGLIDVEHRGRTRLARISRPEVAEAVEALLTLAAESPVTSLSASNRRTALREARTCYDHLAGWLGVALADHALDRGWVIERHGVWLLPDDNPSLMADAIGLPLQWPLTTRPAVRACPDWTERRPHLAGHLGAMVLGALLDAGWVRRRRHDRAVHLTDDGREGLAAAGVPIAG